MPATVSESPNGTTHITHETASQNDIKMVMLATYTGLAGATLNMIPITTVRLIAFVIWMISDIALMVWAVKINLAPLFWLYTYYFFTCIIGGLLLLWSLGVLP
jgi:hypothetical protein